MTAIYLVLAYLLGAIPTGYLFARLARGVDIRTVGSGNIGATNILRAFGWKPGLAVLAADMAKGALVAGPLASWLAAAPGGWVAAAGGLTAVLGHDYTVFLGMRGGKGVATSCGVLLVLAPRSTLATLVVFAVVVWATRMVSAGSLAGALALPLFLWLLGERQAPVLCLSLLLCAFIWLKHTPNIRRMLAGTERTISLGRRPDDEASARAPDDRERR
ncbi:acyl-phosphate glycerol 3-phosphate acyltransferase [Sorangium cellulosum]|uniref:Glycerol-3-phosphate acyltransferase n=1 Tax=Sorangium cellulosum TaxID=56 RepID=A0A150QTN3_SORCE|nr:acyl-phosphate glycerol 3-phosphate acyltransferase [Sorangium cellulosum]